MLKPDRRFCVACHEMQLVTQFNKCPVMCDWCCRNFDEHPPPRCPLCGQYYSKQKQADECCTEGKLGKD